MQCVEQILNRLIKYFFNKDLPLHRQLEKYFLVSLVIGWTGKIEGAKIFHRRTGAVHNKGGAHDLAAM